MDKLLVLYRISVDTRQQEFEDAYRKCKPHIECVPWHISEKLLRSVSDPSSYTIMSIWQPEDFYAWLPSPSHAEVVNMLNTYKRGESKISRYTIVERFDRLPQQYSIS